MRGEQLAAALARRAGHPVECVYRGPVYGWQIEWTDGLTVPEMSAILASLSNRVLGARELEKFLSRFSSEFGQMAALLLWLNDHPGAMPYSVNEGTAYLAFDSISCPERVAEVWWRRAEALLLVIGPGAAPSEAAHVLMGASGRSWHDALAWVDRIAGFVCSQSVAA